MPKPLTVWITINCGKFWKRLEDQTTWPASWETCMQIRKQQLELDMGTTDWFQIGKGVRQGCILPPCLFNLYMQSEVKVVPSCSTLCDPMDYTYTAHGILQARILEWVAFLFSRGSSQPRDQTQVSCIAGGFFTSWATREAQEYWSG